MERPVKLSKWFKGMRGKMEDYITALEKDLEQLYSKFKSFITFNSVQIGSDKGSVFIDPNGEFSLSGTATVWDDVRVPGLQARANASAPDLEIFTGTLLCYAFDGTNILEQVYFQIQIPHTYKLNTPLAPHVHWSPSSANKSNVNWNLEYTWADVNSSFPNSTTINVTQAASGIKLQHQLAELPDISGKGTDVSTMLVCRLYRKPDDALDTYPDDAFLLEFDIHYEIDTLGSKSELTKN